ncbi:MAG: hypothetical protein OEM99_15100, partial [Gammaproteobacteria bacterium]|nr:hypothetical protein [Gammaproteobacteria bacterium]
MKAQDTSTIESLAGNIGSSAVAVGASVATNTIGNTIRAYIDNSIIDAGVTGVDLDATSNATIKSIAVSGALAMGFSGNASVSVNEIDNTVDAHISGGSSVTSLAGPVSLTATDTATIESLAGNVSVGAAGAAFGAAVATNTIGNTIQAYIDNSTIEPGVTSVDLDATSNATIKSLAVSGAAGGATVSASVSLNEIDSIIDSHISGASNVTATGAITVDAKDTSTIESLSGNVGIGAGGALGASVATNDIGNTVKAYIDGSIINAGISGVDLNATSDVTLKSLAVSGALSAGFSANASVIVNKIGNTVEAYISGGSVNVDGDVTIDAHENVNFVVTAGTIAAGTVGVGASIVTANLTSTTRAFIDGSAEVSSGGDVLITADRGIDVTATGFAGSVGGVAAQAAGAFITDSGGATAFIGGTAEIIEADEVSIMALNNRTLTVKAFGGSVGAVAAGASVVDVSASGTTEAYIGNGVQIGQRAGKTVNDVVVEAKSDDDVKAEVIGIAAGIGGGSFNEATATVTPVTQAYIGDADITVTNDIDIIAQALGSVTATAKGVNIGAIAIGGSNATANWKPDVYAYVGGQAVLKSGGDVTLQALNNFLTDGTPDSTRLIKARAENSQGSLAGGIGSNAIVDIDADVQAYVGASADVYAGNATQLADINIFARSRNNADAEADGTSVGAVAAGSTEATATIRNQALAFTGNGTQLNPTILTANNITISSESNNQARVDAIGVGGGAAAVGTTNATAEILNNQIHAIIGDWNVINATGLVDLHALNITDIQADASQVAAGGVTFLNAKGTVTISGSLTKTSIGAHTTVKAEEVIILAEDRSIFARAESFANTNFSFGGFTTAESKVNANVRALAEVKQDALITAFSQVSIIAENASMETDADANSKTLGVSGNLKSTADNTRTAAADVVAAPGSTINTSNLFVEANAPHFQEDGYLRTADTDAKTLTSKVKKLVGYVIEFIADVACLWGLICDPKKISTPVYEFVEVVIGAQEKNIFLGSDNISNSITFNSEVNIGGAADAILEVDENGQILQAEGLVVTDGILPVFVGDIIGTNDIVVERVENIASGQIVMRALNGSTAGSPTFNYDLALDTVTIINKSDKNLTINDIETINVGQTAPAISIQAERGKDNLNFTIGTDSGTTEIDIRNENLADADIILVGDIDNPGGTTMVTNKGGDILALGTLQSIDTRVMELVSEQGAIGTGDQRISGLLRINEGLLGATLQNTSSALGVYLDLTPVTGDSLPLSIDLTNVSSANGVVDIKINDGLSVDTVGQLVVTLLDGTQLTGTALDDFFDPLLAIGLVAGTEIDLGFAHGFSTGQRVFYDSGDGISIGGLIDGDSYFVIAVDETTIQLAEASFFDPTLGVDGTEDTINLGFAHGFTTGDEVVYRNGGGTSIDGLTNEAPYFVIVVDDNTVQLANTLEDALAGFPIVDLDATLATGIAHSLVDVLSPITLDPTVASGIAHSVTGDSFRLRQGNTITQVNFIDVDTFSNVLQLTEVPFASTVRVADVSGAAGVVLTAGSSNSVSTDILLTGTVSSATEVQLTAIGSILDGNDLSADISGPSAILTA